MKNLNFFILGSTALFFLFSAQGQGTFQNLNFEQANPNPDSPGPVTEASAFPYWSVYYGDVQQTQVEYIGESTGATQVSLIGLGYPSIEFPIDGNYSVLLTGGGTDPGASITQTGLIPGIDQSLLFEAEPESSGGMLSVSVGGVNVQIFAVGGGSDYTLYAANISAWAGVREPLTFSTAANIDGLNAWEIDDISFSPNAVPEPKIVVLTAISGLVFGAHRRFGRKPQGA